MDRNEIKNIVNKYYKTDKTGIYDSSKTVYCFCGTDYNCVENKACPSCGGKNVVKAKLDTSVATRKRISVEVNVEEGTLSVKQLKLMIQVPTYYRKDFNVYEESDIYFNIEDGNVNTNVYNSVSQAFNSELKQALKQLSPHYSELIEHFDCEVCDYYFKREVRQLTNIIFKFPKLLDYKDQCNIFDILDVLIREDIYSYNEGMLEKVLKVKKPFLELLNGSNYSTFQAVSEKVSVVESIKIRDYIKKHNILTTDYNRKSNIAKSLLTFKESFGTIDDFLELSDRSERYFEKEDFAIKFFEYVKYYKQVHNTEPKIDKNTSLTNKDFGKIKALSYILHNNKEKEPSTIKDAFNKIQSNPMNGLKEMATKGIKLNNSIDYYY